MFRASACRSSVVPEEPQSIYSEFDDEFEDIESPVGHCEALYTFEGTFKYSRSPCSGMDPIHLCVCVRVRAGNSEGTVSITAGELLSIMEEDKGDGWMRVLRGNGEEGYIPSSYVKLTS